MSRKERIIRTESVGVEWKGKTRDEIGKEENEKKEVKSKAQDLDRQMDTNNDEFFKFKCNRSPFIIMKWTADSFMYRDRRELRESQCTLK